MFGTLTRSRRQGMRRALTLTLLLALTLGVSACGGSKKSSSSTSSDSTKVEPANITMWTPFVDPELKTLKAVVKDFEATHAGIHVKVIGGTNDDKIVAAIRGGNAPDVAQSFSSDNTGAFCPSGAWIDLGPYMKKERRRGLDLPDGSARLHDLRGHPVRPPDAGGHLRSLLQQGAAREGRLQEPAEDDLAAHRDGEEAHAARRERQAEGRRLQPVPELVRERPRTLRPLVGRTVDGRRQVEPQHAPVAGPAALAEEPRRLVRLRQPRPLQRRRRRRVLRVERVRDGQGCDAHGR